MPDNSIENFADLVAEVDTLRTNTEASFTQVNTNLNAPTVGQFIYDYQNGKHGLNTNPDRGADTFIPFKNLLDIQPFLIRNSSKAIASNVSLSNSIYNVEEYASVVLTAVVSFRFLIAYGSNDLAYDSNGGLAAKTEIIRAATLGDLIVNVSAYKYLQVYLEGATTLTAFELKSWTV